MANKYWDGVSDWHLNSVGGAITSAPGSSDIAYFTTGTYNVATSRSVLGLVVSGGTNSISQWSVGISGLNQSGGVLNVVDFGVTGDFIISAGSFTVDPGDYITWYPDSGGSYSCSIAAGCYSTPGGSGYSGGLQVSVMSVCNMDLGGNTFPNLIVQIVLGGTLTWTGDYSLLTNGTVSTKVNSGCTANFTTSCLVVSPSVINTVYTGDVGIVGGITTGTGSTLKFYNSGSTLTITGLWTSTSTSGSKAIITTASGSNQNIVLSGTSSFSNNLSVDHIHVTGSVPISAIGSTDGGNNVGWTFTPPSHTLTYTAGSHGSISGITPQTVADGGDGTEVTAVPDAHYHFTSWSDAVLTASRTDLDVHSDITVTASFSIDTYTLTYTASSGGSLSGVSPQTVDYGGSGTAVSAIPDGTHTFQNWSDFSVDNPRTDINVTANLSVTANFLINPPVITSSLSETVIQDTSFDYFITGTNTPISFSASTLPDGLSINSGTGEIYGTPTTVGLTHVTIGATNAGGTGTDTLDITVTEHSPVFTSPDNTVGYADVSFSFQPTASYSPTSWSASGLPYNLSINPTTGLITGTDPLSGVYSVTLSATNSGGTTTQAFTLTMDASQGGSFVMDFSGRFTYLTGFDDWNMMGAGGVSPEYTGKFWVAHTQSNFSNSANWSSSSGGVGGAGLPLPTDLIIFDGGGQGNCIFDAPVYVKGIIVDTTYNGSIRQGAYQLKFGVSGFTQKGGYFIGGTAPIYANGEVDIQAGSFTSTSGLMQLLTNIYFSSPAIFLHNNGVVSTVSSSTVGIYGAFSWYTFLCGLSSTIIFEAGNNQIVNMTFGSHATRGNPAFLKSSSPGNLWGLNLIGVSDLRNTVKVQDSDARYTIGKAVLAPGSVSLGNVFNWDFGGQGYAVGGWKTTLPNMLPEYFRIKV
jgi:hypothetical protein